MKKLIFYILTGLWLLVVPEGANGQVVAVASEAVDSVETVVPDRKRYDSFKKNLDFDYYNIEIEKPKENNFLQRLYFRFIEWLMSKTGSNYSTGGIDLTFVLIIVVVLIVLLVLVFTKSLFFRNKRRKAGALDDEDNIYGRDFEGLIKNAIQNNDYNEAVRWRFLQVLKWLEDREIINWNPNKTVIEYIYEIKNADTKDSFRDLCRYFLYFRYGDFSASEKHYLSVDELAAKIIDTPKR